MSIFISHASKEAVIANELCEALEEKNLTCFIAPRDIRSGFEYAEEIANGIDNSEFVLLLLSKASNESPHVLREIERAVTKSIPVVVYQLENVELTKSMEYFLMTRQWMVAGRESYGDVIKCISGMKEKNVNVNKKPETKEKKGGNRILAIAALLFGGLLLAAMGYFVLSNKEFQFGRSELEMTVEELKTGDEFIMGNYNGEPITWCVLHISEDGKEAVVVSRDVLTIKAPDAPDSGKYNHDGKVNYSFDDEILETDPELQAYVRGNNSWENSNIRTWLNSDEEIVKYEGQAPVSAAMADTLNGYNHEKGFLCSFNEEELSFIKDTEVVTKGNVLTDGGEVITSDKVFLLSMDELKWFDEADVSLISVPTAAAVEANSTYWYEEYCLALGIDAIAWWLREPYEGSSSKCYLVGNGYSDENIYPWEVGVESFGIRPAMTIDISGEK